MDTVMHVELPSSNSRLSAEAACFVPNNFQQNVPPILPLTYSLDDYSYARKSNGNFGAPGLSQPPFGRRYHENPRCRPPVAAFGHYTPPPPLSIDYYSYVQCNGLSSGLIQDQENRVYLDYYSPSLTGVSPVDVGSLTSVETKTAPPYGTGHPGLNEAVAGSFNGCTTNGEDASIPFAQGKILKSKSHRKRKSRNKIQNDVIDQKTKNVESKSGGKVRSIATQNDTGLVSCQTECVNQTVTTVNYRDNEAQTDFTDELSSLTLSEKPNLLYRSFNSSTTERELQASGTNDNTRTSKMESAFLQSTGRKPDTKARSGNLMNSKSGENRCPTAAVEGLRKVSESPFDHSSMRSESGRRASTGISTCGKSRSGESNSSDVSYSEKVKSQRSVDKSYQRQEPSTERAKAAPKSADKVVSSQGKAVGLSSYETLKQGGTSSIGKIRSQTSAESSRTGSKSFRTEASKSPSWRSKTVETFSKSKSASSDTHAPSLRSTSGGRLNAEHFKENAKQIGKATKSQNDRDKNNSSKILTKDKNENRNSVANQNNATLSSAVATRANAKETAAAEKRKRKRHKKKTDADETNRISDKTPNHDSNATVFPISSERNVRLPFDDDDEFPILLRAAQGLDTSMHAPTPIKYSDILSGRVRSVSRNNVQQKMANSVAAATENSEVRNEYDSDDDEFYEVAPLPAPKADLLLGGAQTKKTGENGKKRSQSQPAVVKEHKVVVKEHKAVKAGKKTKEPIVFDLFDMIARKSSSKTAKDEAKKQQKDLRSKSQTDARRGNMLDSSAVLKKRGKEREVPKKKKPSLMRKVILKERESRRQKFLQDCGLVEVTSLSPDNPQESSTVKGENDGAPFPQQTAGPITCKTEKSSTCTKTQQPTASEESDKQRRLLLSVIHSRRFREYCNQVLSKEIDSCCTLFLQELVRFQDRTYHKDPTKAKMKRRLVLGLREVHKHLKVNKLKCIIISPNLERVQSKGGLDEILHNIVQLCQEQSTPFVFALNRKQLGKACSKRVPVSIVGIFNYEGAEDHFNRLRELTENAREMYAGLVVSTQKELDNYLAAAADPDSVEECREKDYLSDPRLNELDVSSNFADPTLEERGENYPTNSADDFSEPDVTEFYENYSEDCELTLQNNSAIGLIACGTSVSGFGMNDSCAAGSRKASMLSESDTVDDDDIVVVIETKEVEENVEHGYF